MLLGLPTLVHVTKSKNYYCVIDPKSVSWFSLQLLPEKFLTQKIFSDMLS